LFYDPAAGWAPGGMRGIAKPGTFSSLRGGAEVKPSAGINDNAGSNTHKPSARSRSRSLRLGRGVLGGRSLVAAPCQAASLSAFAAARRSASVSARLGQAATAAATTLSSQTEREGRPRERKETGLSSPACSPSELAGGLNQFGRFN